MFLKKTLALLFGIFTALLVFEVTIRFTPFAELHMVTYDKWRGFALLPGAHGWYAREGRAYIRINHDGLRDVDHTKAKPKGVFRIAVLGDSYAEAQQIDLNRTFWWVMQEKLRACPALSGEKVEAINFGVRAYGTVQEWLSLRYYAWQYSPDFVVLAIYIGNDIVNNSVVLEANKCRPFLVERQGKFVLGGPFFDSPTTRFRCFVRYESRHSQVANILGDAVMRIRSAIRERLNKNHNANSPRDDGAWFLNPVYVEPRDEVWREAWDATDAAITMTAKEAQSHGVGFLAVTLSDAFQVYPDPARREAYQRALGVSDLFYPERRIAKLGEREGFEVLNLAPIMQAYADRYHVYLHGFPNTELGGGHWNELGHKLAGELIAQRICDMLSRGSTGRSIRAGADESAPSPPLALSSSRQRQN